MGQAVLVSIESKSADQPCTQQWTQLNYARYLTSITSFYYALKRCMKPHCIGITEYRILIRLMTHNGILGSQELCRMLKLSPGTVALSLSKLEKTRAIERVENVTREVPFKITARGIKQAQEIRTLMRPLFDRMWHEFPDELHGYIYESTLCVAEIYDLYPRATKYRPADVALSEEAFLTTNIVAQICNEGGASILGYQMLLSLKESLDGLHPGELAKKLQTRANCISATSKQLQNASLIRQVHDGIDKRATILEITSDGWAVWSDIDKKLDAFFRSGLLPDLGQDDVIKHHAIAESVLESKLYSRF